MFTLCICMLIKQSVAVVDGRTFKGWPFIVKCTLVAPPFTKPVKSHLQRLKINTDCDAYNTHTQQTNDIFSVCAALCVRFFFSNFFFFPFFLWSILLNAVYDQIRPRPPLDIDREREIFVVQQKWECNRISLTRARELIPN